MTGQVIETLCRICLGNGAIIPIFEQNGNKTQVHPNLCLCFSENVVDVEGYPRNICNKCNDMLDSVCEFIIRFKKSSDFFKNGLYSKHCVSEFSDNEPNPHEFEINDIKVEFTQDLDENQFKEECLTKLSNLPQLKIPKVKIRKHQNKKPQRITKSKTIKGTNKTASSILEGDFCWTGEKWCLKKSQLIIKPQCKVEKKYNKKKKKDIVIQLPRKPNVNPPRLCDLCGEVFKTQSTLTVHKRKVHFKSQVKCPKCPKYCVSDYYLGRHMKRKHDKTRNFFCSTCNAGFTYRGELTTHINSVHNKHLLAKKVFKCQFCDKTYKCRRSIIVHERSVHTGLRPAECSVCGSRFFHDDYLREHMRLHTGETPFKCPVCGRGYAQSGNMKSHLRTHRKSELDPITLSKIKPNYLKFIKG